ncbi:MAG: TonB-dependent receptor [Marinifilaceae bacterium]|jgi:hypothetical protein|nr:TonB-dependent receptor [Marinifilaceae bacterium]
MNKWTNFLLLILLLVFSIESLEAKANNQTKIDIGRNKCQIIFIINKFKEKLGFDFAYSSSQIDTKKEIQLKAQKISISDFLNQLQSIGISSRIKQNTVVLFKSKEKKKIRISGYVEDGESGERLIGANIYDSSNYKGTTTNNYGFFAFDIDNTKQINVSFVGYSSLILPVNFTNDTSLVIALKPNVQINEVVVKAGSSDMINSKDPIGRMNLSMQKIKALPTSLGEVDVMKSAQLLPGISEGSEGNTGMYVRGGSDDQNLIILDGVNVYNPNHLFGFLSVFNADAIKNCTILKGGFPARYGGKLSSVVDMNMREGNMKKLSGSVSLGLLSSKAYLEGPLIKDKTSFFVSARRTYLDLFGSQILSNLNDYDHSNYYFYDINAKINHKFNNKHRLYLSYYKGRDSGSSKDQANQGDKKLVNEEETEVNWGNSIYGLRWNWLLSSNLFLNTSLSYSSYDYMNDESVRNQYETDSSTETKEYSNKVETGINMLSAGLDFSYYLSDKHNLRFGLKYSKQEYNTGMNSKKYISGKDIKKKVKEKDLIKADEYNVYLEDDISLSQRLGFNIGGHLSMFSVNNKDYKSIEPRLSFNYDLSDKIQLNGGAAFMQQYSQLLSFSRISLSSDIWVPATDKILPAKSKQASLGFKWKINKKYSFSTETYYKKLDNVLEYSESASFFAKDSWQDRVEQGKGKSYGVEFLLEKSKGKLNGWIAYTLAESTRQFDNINNGKEFPYKYDRRHDANIVLNYNITNNWSVSSVWKYRTGNAETLGLVKYKSPMTFNSNVSSADDIIYQKRNNYRMPAYHRLDLAINYTKTINNITHTVSFGVFNAYNRKNPYKISVKDKAVKAGDYYIDTKTLEEKSLFGILPSFNYSLKF